MSKWIISLLVCRGNHHCMMHFLGDEKRWECSRCGRFFPIPEFLTRASGEPAPRKNKNAPKGRQSSDETAPPDNTQISNRVHQTAFYGRYFL